MLLVVEYEYAKLFYLNLENCAMVDTFFSGFEAASFVLRLLLKAFDLNVLNREIFTVFNRSFVNQRIPNPYFVASAIFGNIVRLTQIKTTCNFFVSPSRLDYTMYTEVAREQLYHKKSISLFCFRLIADSSHLIHLRCVQVWAVIDK